MDVEEVELLSANPNYAYIRTRTGLENTLCVRDLAPLPRTKVDQLTNADNCPLLERLPSSNTDKFSNSKVKLIHVLLRSTEKAGTNQECLEDLQMTQHTEPSHRTSISTP